METLALDRTSWLSWFARGILVLGGLLLLGRLFELTIIKGDYYYGLSEGNRIRRVPIVAPRGQILARGGEILVGNNKDGSRDYLLGEAAAHLTGYLGEANEEEVGRIKGECPEKGPVGLGDLVGRGGVEEQYDCTLRGVDGETLVEVDTADQVVRTLGTREPVAGKDVKTNIDLKLQKKLAEVMEEKPGAAVITDDSGEVLALYSSPSFDPQNVSPSLSDEDLPLFNRVISGLYHPGSVFKIVAATAALEEGKIDKDFVFDDPGVMTIKADPQAEIMRDYTYSNWYFSQYGRKEGVIDLPRAIARSTDTFFYQLGELLGVNALVSWARTFGLDEKTGVDLPGETAGLVPDPKWKMRVKGERWFLGNTFHLAIGQGDIALTPLAVNTVTEVIASAGRHCVPKVAGEVDCRRLRIDQETIDLIKKGMVGACSEGGTAFPFFDFSPQVACKTGTAETNEEDKTHAWFTVFAPADYPELVITIMVEKGGEGSDVAAPIAREILDYYFHP